MHLLNNGKASGGCHGFSKECLNDVSLKLSHPAKTANWPASVITPRPCGITEMTDIVSALVQA